MVKNDIIFICHGNVNRSRAAEEIMKSLRPDLKVDSFAVGIKSKEGRIFTKKMRTLLEKNGYNYDINKRSKILTKQDVENSNLIYVMDKNNVKHYNIRFEDGSEKLRFLGELIGVDNIKDPGFSKGIEEYKKSFSQIEKCCKIIAENYEKL